MKFLFALLALIAPAAAFAADDVVLDSKVFVERTTQDASGQPKTVLEAPKLVTPGDRLLFVLSYKNVGAKPASNFVVTNPLPASVVFSGFEGQPASVSIDGGASWGKLGELKVKQADGSFRSAEPADVTQVRWTLGQPIPSGEGGKLSFRGVVK